MKTLQWDYGDNDVGLVRPHISNSEFSFGPPGSNRKREEIQQQRPQSPPHGPYRDHEPSNYRDRILDQVQKQSNRDQVMFSGARVCVNI